MAQQQAPVVGEVMDGYRFKGGDPAQQSSWEQVAPVDVSSEYGAGARRLPNGVIERVGPQGGVTRIAAANGGPEAAPMVGADARARFMINLGPLQSAQANMERMDGAGYNLNQDWGAAALEAIPFDGGFAARVAGGEDYNAYTQAAKTFEAAIMPIMSGAAVTPSEAQRLIRAALPQPGDSPEVLAQKSEQRRQMINAVAQGIGQDAPYADPQAQTDEYGLPEYGIEGGREIAVSPVAGQPPAGPTLPGSGPDAPIDISGLSATDLMALQPGQYLRFPDGRVERLSGAPRVGASGEEVAPGVFQERMSPEQTLDARREDEGLGRRVDAFVRGAADTVTFGLSDEITAGLNTVAPVDRGTRGGWDGDWRGAYRQNLDLMRGIDAADADQMPITRGAGQFAGGAMMIPRTLAAGAGRTLLQNSVRGAGAGAAYGGAYGFGSGQGNALERAPDAARGAGFGAVAGGAAPSIINAGGRVVSPMVNALSDAGAFIARPFVNALGDNAPQALREAVAPNDLARGLERFAGTNRPDVNALNATREQLEGAVGRPVAAASVVNTGGRAMLRGVATRSDGAREIAENFGQGTAEALPARVGAQGRRILSNDTRSPDEIRAALEAERSGAARTTYAEPYAQPVQIGEDIAGALSGAPGRSAIQRARAAAEAWQDIDVMAELDALEAAVRAGQPLPQVSAGAVDRIRQALSGRGQQLAQRPGTRAVGAGVQNRAGQVDQALENVEGLAPARAAYRDTSRQIKAVTAGEQFAGNSPDVVASAMRGAPESAQAPFRAGAARSIERAAGTTGSAPGVANRLAIPGTPQRQMMDETLGPDDAQRLSDAMRGERDIYRGAQQVDPGVGSQTTNNAMKAMDAAGAIGDVAAGRPLGAVRRVIGMLDSRGFSPQQAEAVLSAMTDPARTDEVIAILAERMSRREARNLTRALRYQLTIAPQSGQHP
jgi:hypothetical protein